MQSQRNYISLASTHLFKINKYAHKLNKKFISIYSVIYWAVSTNLILILNLILNYY